MNYLNKYESFQTNEEIHQICEKYKITNYTINSDGSIDVYDTVSFFDSNLEYLPLKFNHVRGNFDCSYNELTTLEGSPQIVDGSFDCSSNKLTTLEGGPQYVGDHFCCSYNKLTTLEGSPKYVEGDFWCSYNKLTTLKGVSQTVYYFDCHSNKNLKSLNYLPKNIHSEEVDFEDTAVYEIFKLIGNDSLLMVRYVNDSDVVVDDNINLEMLNAILYDEGKPPVEKVKGYINI